VTDRLVVDDVDEANQLCAVALTLIRNYLEPVALRPHVQLPVETPEDAMAVMGALLELAAVFVRRAAHAERTTPEDLMRAVMTGVLAAA
jgi:hypothetical protein